MVRSPDEIVQCSCGATKRKIISTRGAGIDWFKPDWYEHIAKEPIFVESKKQLKAECEKHGCYSVALLNENKGTGISQEIASNPDLARKRANERKRAERITNEAYRQVFGDV